MPPVRSLISFGLTSLRSTLLKKKSSLNVRLRHKHYCSPSSFLHYLLNMNSHYLALSSLITLFFFSTILPPSYCIDDERFVECSRPFDCGRIKNIPYPFLGGDRPDYCGFPAFKLTCRDNEYPIISFEELEFRVLNINQSHYIMTIARSDLWNIPCLPAPKFIDTTLDFINFDYHTPTDQNLTLFFGCPSEVSGLDGVNYFPCGLDNTAIYFVNESLTGIHELFEKCHGNIGVPVLGTALKNESLGLQNVLNQGFDVDYQNSWAITCLGCEDSGGTCGFNSSSHPFVCLCRDGDRQPLFCSSKYAYSFLLSLLD